MEISSGSTQADSVFCNDWDCATDESHCGSYTTVQVKILVYFQNSVTTKITQLLAPRKLQKKRNDWHHSLELSNE